MTPTAADLSSKQSDRKTSKSVDPPAKKTCNEYVSPVDSKQFFGENCSTDLPNEQAGKFP